jgi:lipopolysaccharide transport system permease protein
MTGDSASGVTAGDTALPAPFILTSRPELLRVLLGRMWEARALVGVLTRRDFFVRYRRATFGVLWAIGLPAVQATVIITVFSRVVRIPTQVPYTTFVFAGITVWTFFSAALSTASTAVVDGASLASKVYFPRALLPLIAVGSSLFGLAVTVVLFVGVDLVDTRHLGVEILLVAPAVLLVCALALGFGLVGSALHVYFRDVRFIVQASLLAWFYITPVFYPVTLVGGPLRAVVLANPLTGVVELMRAATVGTDTSLIPSAAIATGWAVGLLAAGLTAHARFDRLFTDLL